MGINGQRVIVAGSRGVTDFEIVWDAVLESGFCIGEIVSGMARGVDRLGVKVAQTLGIGVARFPADWGTHGRSAGFIRNQQMADYADCLVAVWDGRSRGTQDMINRMKLAGKEVHVVIVG
jgi:hypothetical protein